MSVTIEHNAHIFWDYNGIFPGNVGDAFKQAGAKVEYLGNCEMVVRGLEISEARKIANAYDADYLGPVIALNPPPRVLKDVTPNKKAHGQPPRKLPMLSFFSR
jgi:hypothetical protein